MFFEFSGKLGVFCFTIGWFRVKVILLLQMLVDVSSSLSSSCCSVTSLLRLAKVSTSDEGLYTCRPAGTRGEDRVALHVLHPPVVEQRLPSKLANSQAGRVHLEVVAIFSLVFIPLLWESEKIVEWESYIEFVQNMNCNCFNPLNNKIDRKFLLIFSWLQEWASHHPRYCQIQMYSLQLECGA